MYVKKIVLRDFRNYKKGSVSFTPQTNIIYGKNARGKTNILEAIYLSGTTKSHRLASEKELIKIGESSGAVKTIFFAGGRQQELLLKIMPNKKQFLLNNVPCSKSSEILGTLCPVIFCPEDIKTIKGAPRFRRNQLDFVLCSLYPKYTESLKKYNKILQHRNKLLRMGGGDEIWVFDEQLAKYGSFITFCRYKYFNEIAKYAKVHMKKISNESAEFIFELGFAYKKEEASPEDYKNAILAELVGNRENDLRIKATKYGAHRNDFYMKIDGKDSRFYASQGQTRTLALAIKMAEADYIKEITKEEPVLLLDDVLSELDSERQKYILRNYEGRQLIITTTDKDLFGEIGENVNLIDIEEIQLTIDN
jgi:DNA replication and repair protein RecF